MTQLTVPALRSTQRSLTVCRRLGYDECDHPVDVEAEVAPGVSLSPAIAPDEIGFAVSGRF